MSDHDGDRLHPAASLALPGEQVRCPNCHAPLWVCDNTGCGQRQKPGWRTAQLATGDDHRAMALRALEGATDYLEHASVSDADRNEIAQLYLAEKLTALTHAVLYVGDQLAKGGDA
ncbi:hypothetical protein ACQEVF_59060 [Nonomuraea polychroma]|uniref:hypothetical protein n=1 Tax=Nonomuraea polychroma TaxID=46176 RepID=UPI003D8C828B